MNQNKTLNKRLCISLILNVLIAVFEIIAVILTFTEYGNFTFFKYYTQDSNILLGISCVIMAVFKVRSLRSGKEVPYSAKLFSYIATCCTTLTITVVLALLIPNAGGYTMQNFSSYMLEGSALFMHFVCPVLALVSFIIFEDVQLSFLHTLYALIPTLIYAVALFILNIENVLVGPYFFLHVYEQSVLASVGWSFVVLGINYLMSVGIWALSKKNKKSTT